MFSAGPDPGAQDDLRPAFGVGGGTLGLDEEPAPLGGFAPGDEPELAALDQPVVVGQHDALAGGRAPGRDAQEGES